MAINSAVLHQALRLIHYLSPLVVVTYFFLAVTISVCTLQNLKGSRTRPRIAIVRLAYVILALFLLEGCMLMVDTLANYAGQSSTDGNTYALSNVLIWAILATSLQNTERPVWYPHVGSWTVSLISEILLLAIKFAHGFPASIFTYNQSTIQACRLLCLISLPTLLFVKSSKNTCTTDEESTALLGQPAASSRDSNDATQSSGYGSIPASSNKADLDDEAKQRKKEEDEEAKLEKRLQESGTWFGYIAGYSILLPFMWPSKSRSLQLNIVGVAICILCTRALRVLEPRQLGIVLDHLDPSQGHIPVPEFLLLLLFGFLDTAVVTTIKRLLWTPVDLNMRSSINTAAYNQIMDLSYDFHTEKQTGELFVAISQGSSITQLLEIVAFRIGPTLIDIVVAFSYLYHVFGPYMALNVAATNVVYLWAAIYIVAKQSGPQRKAQKLARKQNQLMYDTVGGWSSVSYFNRQRYEQERYSQAVALARSWSKKVEYMAYLGWAAEDVVVEIGLIVAGMIAVYQIAAGTQKIGNFAMLMTYWGSFTSNIAYIASTQSQIRSSLIDAESLLELLQKKPTIQDGPNSFNLKHGAISFQEVTFSYDGKKETIQDFTFHAAPGQKIALVGETGGGKSTILKLLFRFYDVQKGKILIDDQDIKDVTLQSLRQSIGVVPQDAVLFNDTVMENVRYSKLGASDEEVIEACKGAAVHDKISTFTEGYQTVVGEDGVKLSGGELQRVAIARVILKNPDIILLDEATSAVDTETEACIQDALHKLTKGRTTFTIAHRLSTIMDSDVIVVIKEGKIVEHGKPQALLEAKGKFSELWLRQVGVNPLPREDQSTDEKSVDKSGVLQVTEGQQRKHLAEASSSSAKSLRATAPEFVPQKRSLPRNRRGTNSQGGSVSPRHAESGQQDSNEPLDPKEVGSSDKPHQKGKLPEKSVTDNVRIGSHGATSAARTGNAGPIETKKKRPNPAQRRRNNKSEPSGSTTKSSQHIGQSDIPTADETAKLPTRLQFRRVSAPLSNTTNSQDTTRPQRRRTQKWQQRKRQPVEQTSENGSHGGLGNTSTRTLPPQAPIVRLPGSSGGDGSRNGNNTAGAGTGSVHFALGF